jgi:hypothetical protein
MPERVARRPVRGRCGGYSVLLRGPGARTIQGHFEEAADKASKLAASSRRITVVAHGVLVAPNNSSEKASRIIEHEEKYSMGAEEALPMHLESSAKVAPQQLPKSASQSKDLLL